MEIKYWSMIGQRMFKMFNVNILQVFQGYTDPDEILADYEWEKPLTAEEKVTTNY
jgi:hypothetical protein